MTSNHNYDYFNGGCHGMAANVPQLYLVADFENENLNYSQN